MPAPGPSDVIDLAVAGDGSAWALSGTGNTLYELVRAQTWTNMGGTFTDLAAASDGSAWAINADSDPGTFARYDADSSSWNPLSTPSGATISQITAGSEWSVFGLDGTPVGELWSYDVDSDSWLDLSITIKAISALPDGSLWGIETAGDPGYIRPGENWITVTSPDDEFVAIDAATEGWIWAAGASGNVYQYDPSVDPPWIALEAKPPDAPAAIACGDDLSVWILTKGHEVFSYDSASESWLALPSLPSGDSYADIALPDLANAWALALDGSSYRYTVNESSWSPLTTNVSLQHIAAGSAAALWGLDGAGGVYQSSGDPATWMPVTGPPALGSIGVGSDGTVLAVTTAHALVARGATGDSWPAVATPFEPAAVAVGSAGWVIALSTSGVAWSYDGSAWTQQSKTQIFAGIATAADETTWATAAGGTVLERIEVDGWVELAIEAKSVAIGSASDIWVLLPSGEVLNVTDGATTGSEGTPLEGVPLRHGSIMPRWDTEDPFDEAQSTHLWILRRAAMLARMQTNDPAGQQVYDLVNPDVERQAGETFHNSLYQGLYDADFVSFYNGPHVAGKPTWKFHFCDADSLKNYLGQKDPTALTKGLAFFEQAVSNYQQQNLPAAGYALGLATHFFTDLTQPMHACNFYYGASAPDPAYHTDLEASVLEHQADVDPPEHYVELADPSVRQHFIDTASRAKGYFNTLRLDDAQHGESFGPQMGPGYWGFERPYSTAVRRATPSMLRDAVAATAQFLVRWMQATGAIEEFALAADPADTSQLRQMCCLDAAGNLWHQIWPVTGTASGWQLVSGPVSADIGPKDAIATASKLGQQLYVVAVPRQEPSTVRYTYRNQDGSWQQSWTLVTSQFPSSVTSIAHVAAAFDSNGQLQVLSMDSNGILWHTLLSAGAWQTSWGSVATQSAGLSAGSRVACARDGSGGLHVVAVSKSARTPWYTYRASTGTWRSSWLALNSSLSPNMHGLRDITCTTDATNALHVLVVDGNGVLWYAQMVGGTWKTPWGRVGQLTGGAPTMQLVRAAASTDLFVGAVDDSLHDGHLAERYGSTAQRGYWNQGWWDVARPAF